MTSNLHVLWILILSLAQTIPWYEIIQGPYKDCQKAESGFICSYFVVFFFLSPGGEQVLDHQIVGLLVRSTSSRIEVAVMAAYLFLEEYAWLHSSSSPSRSKT